MNSEKAPCGCNSKNICRICFTPMCNGDKDQSICVSCLVKVSEANDKNERIHPVKRTPLRMCNCGKPFVGECVRLAFARGYYTPDPQKLAQCTTLAERHALLTDLTAHIYIDTSHHFLVNK